MNRAYITRVDSQTLDSGRDRICTYECQKRRRRIDTTSRSLHLTIDTFLLSFFLFPPSSSLESDAPLKFNKHTWHCPVFSLFSSFHSQRVAAAKNTA
jgi:hypothetical protein